MITKSSIASLIETHFPSFYLEDGPNFVAFIQAYYEWMENNNQSLDYSKRLLELRDIDTTVDEFVVHFKEKYLTGLPFVTEFDKKFLIKHIHDLYRSKGTERSIDLLFKLLYRQKPTVYYPGQDVFKASSGEWVVPRYIELSPSTRTIDYLNKEIVGTLSGAKAFVEKLTKKRINGKLLDVAYISNVRGMFLYDERVVTAQDPTISNAPRIVGSLTTLTILNGGADFVVGDTMDVITSSGQGGRARVRAISNDTGRVDFQVADGGFGYSTNSTVYVSRHVLGHTGVSNANNLITSFTRFETVAQPMVEIDFSSASNTAAFVNGVVVQEYYANGTLSANGVVLAGNTSSANAGTLIVRPGIGNLGLRPLLTTVGNTATMTVDTFADITATGNVIAQNATSVGVITVTNNFRDYSGNYIYGLESGSNASLIAVSTGTGADFDVGTITNAEQVYITPDLLRANNTGNVSFMSLRLDGSNSNVAANGYGFPKYPAGDLNTPIKTLLRFETQTIGTINTLTNKNPGDNYNAEPFVLVINPPIAEYQYRDYVLSISSATGLFVPGEYVRQTANVLFDLLTLNSASGTAANGAATSNYEVGEFVYQSNGTANTATGIVLETNVVAGNGNIKVNKLSGTFSNTLSLKSLTTNCTANVTAIAPTTTAVNVTGMIRTGSDVDQLYVQRLSFSNEFQSSYYVYGLTSGATAMVSAVGYDYDTPPIGEDAIITANVQVATGAATVVDVIDSGYGYTNGETANLVPFVSNSSSIITARVNDINQGHSEGYYRTTAGQISADQKLHDGYYYQDYSYEVQSKLPLDKYSDVLKQLIHVAGTKMFGKVVNVSNTDITADTINTSRRDVLYLNGANGQINVGSTLTQGNVTATALTSITSVITINDKNTGITTAYANVYQPNNTTATVSGVVVDVVSNTTANTTTLYLNQVSGGVFKQSNTVGLHTGFTLNIGSVANGNTVTGSFAVGETISSANQQTGVVTAANSTQVTISGVSNNWTTSGGFRVTGATSNASANVVTYSQKYTIFTVAGAINTLTVGNTVGYFTTGNVNGSLGSSSANISYVDIKLAQ